jgi:hypothetical protein
MLRIPLQLGSGWAAGLAASIEQGCPLDSFSEIRRASSIEMAWPTGDEELEFTI